jgi:hypothetical protein
VPTRDALEGVEGIGSPRRPTPLGFPPVHATMPMIPAGASPDDVVGLTWLHEWIRAVAEAAGLPLDVILGPDIDCFDIGLRSNDVFQRRAKLAGEPSMRNQDDTNHH